MARTYRNRYYRRRRYGRRRAYRRRYSSGSDRNSFCLTMNRQIVYTFKENSTIGIPDRLVNFGITAANTNTIGWSICDTDKFPVISDLYDQVRLKSMSVNLSYITNNGTSGETLSMVNAIDRSTSQTELTNKIAGAIVTDEAYANYVTSASSAKRVTLIGGRKYNNYVYSRSIQEKSFLPMTNSSTSSNKFITALQTNLMNYFNPVIHSVILRSTSSTAATNIVINAEIKFYIECKNSI